MYKQGAVNVTGEDYWSNLNIWGSPDRAHKPTFEYTMSRAVCRLNSAGSPPRYSFTTRYLAPGSEVNNTVLDNVAFMVSAYSGRTRG